ncbi:hypothetical protein CHARACLAT_030530, partial [Characodon lateralis]|nr:hypothetical protein [Characodon lateralis]
MAVFLRVFLVLLSSVYCALQVDCHRQGVKEADLRSVIEATSDDISAGRHGESITTKEDVEHKGGDEGEEHRGPDDEEEGEEHRAAERVEARLYSEDPSEWPLPQKTGDTFRQYMVENGPQKVSHGPYPTSEK